MMRGAPYFWDSFLAFMRQPFFQALLQRRIFKFCVVGASSTVIDKGIFWLLMTAYPSFPWWLSQSISFIFGVTNGFFWNRFWTFKSDEHASMTEQYPKFVLSNIIGLALNLLITKGFLILFTGHAQHNANTDKMIILVASLCAVPLVVVWNFTASRLWTFKPPATPTPVGHDEVPIASPHPAPKS